MVSDSSNVKNIEKSISMYNEYTMWKIWHLEIRPTPQQKKKVGSTELAETLSKLNYNQYLVDKRGWSENDCQNFTNKSNYEPKVTKKGPLTLREYVLRRLITLREDLYESLQNLPCRRDSHNLLRQQSENVKLRRPGWPETHFHEEFHEISNSMIFSIFFNIF